MTSHQLVNFVGWQKKPSTLSLISHHLKMVPSIQLKNINNPYEKVTLKQASGVIWHEEDFKWKRYLLFCVHDLKRCPLCLCSCRPGKAARWPRHPSRWCSSPAIYSLWCCRRRQQETLRVILPDLPLVVVHWQHNNLWGVGKICPGPDLVTFAVQGCS